MRLLPGDVAVREKREQVVQPLVDIRRVLGAGVLGEHALQRGGIMGVERIDDVGRPVAREPTAVAEE